jgi:translation elongation factor EF-Ts/pimeloyl-ACP methyl ester carboxylesterase
MSTNPQDGAARPTVVLVHGAFADASSWNGVVERLQADGVQVTAPPNPLRGISIDSAYINSLLDQIPGPVLAVGHSYGGAVITNAATNANNVVGLVYVAAFVPDEGERLIEIENDSKDSVLNTALMPLKYPTGEGQETAVEFAIDPEKFHDAFAADLSAEQSAVMAATQRSVAESAFSEPSGAPAWKKVPSWAVVAIGDKAAGADVVRSMAERAGATITEVDGSHVIMVSQPQAVADVILTALAAVPQKEVGNARATAPSRPSLTVRSDEGERERGAVLGGAIEKVKRLREETSAGITDVRRALERSGGDVEGARRLLGDQERALATEKGAREAPKGLIEAYVHFNGRVGVLVEVDCETDFALRTPEVKELARKVALHVASEDPLAIAPEDVPPEAIEEQRAIAEKGAVEAGADEDAEGAIRAHVEKFASENALLTQPFVKDRNKTVGDLLRETIRKVDENVVVRRFVRYEAAGSGSFCRIVDGRTLVVGGRG